MTMGNKNALSTVVSTALLVGVVVALVSLLSFTLFNLQDGGDNLESVQASIDMTATETGVKVGIIKNENVEEFVVKTPGGSTKTLQNVGDSVTVDDGVGVYSVVGVLSDGTEEVIDTRRIDSDDFGGLFTVNQDVQQKEADAIVQKDFESTDSYEITVVTKGSDLSGSTTAFDGNDDDGQLLSNPAEETGDVLQSQGIGIGAIIDVDKEEVLPVAQVSKNPNARQFTIGEPVRLHQITNLCEGDKVYLLDSESGEVISGGEEIKFDAPDCDKLRRIVTYEGNEPVATQLINLWNQDVGYSAFKFNGNVPPPTRPVPEGDELSVTVTVYEQQSDGTKGSLITNGEVTLGDLGPKPTNSDGEVTFNVGAEDVTIFATANAPGFFSSQAPIDLSSSGLVNNDRIEEEVLLPPKVEQSFSEPSDPKSSGSIPPGSSKTIDFTGGGGGTAGVFISGGSGGSFGGGGGGSDTVSSTGGIYSGRSVSTTSTDSAPAKTSSPEQEKIVEDLVQPQRKFNTLPIDKDLIPSGEEGEFLVRTSVLVPPNQNKDEVEETVIVKAVRESDGTLVNLEGIGGDTQRKTSFLATGQTSVVEQKLHFPSGTASGKYSILVTIDSSEKVLPAGSLEVFQGSTLDASINGAEVSPENPRVTQDGQVTVDVTVDYDENISTPNNEQITLDIFENGQRINTVRNFGPGDVHTESKTYEGNEIGYYEYHVGVQESQDVALADSVLISPKSPSNIDLDATLQVEGSSSEADCNTGTQVAKQFDCEIFVGQSIDISGDISVQGSDVSEFEDAEIILNWKEAPEGEERIYNEKAREENSEQIIEWGQSVSYDPSNFDSNIVGFPDDNTVSFEKTGIQYSNPEAYIVEARLRGVDNDGNQIGAQSDQTLNVALDSNKITSEIVSAGSFNEDTVRLVIESQRSAYEEEVRLDFVHNGEVQNSRSVSVPRDGGQLEMLESLVLPDYQDANANVGEPIDVRIEMYDQKDKRSEANPVDTAQVEFEAKSSIGIDSSIDIIVE